MNLLALDNSSNSRNQIESVNDPTNVNSVSKGEYLLKKQQSCYDALEASQHCHAYLLEYYGSLNHTLT